MPRTAAGGVLLGPEPPNAAGGIPGGGLRMIARLDGAVLRPYLFLFVIGLCTMFQPASQSAFGRIIQTLNPRESIDSMWLHHRYFMPAILELNLCSFPSFVSLG